MSQRNGNYIYIHHKMTLFSKWSIFWFLPKLQLCNLKMVPFYSDYIQGEIDRMIDVDIEAYISRYRYVDRQINGYIDKQID